MAERLSDSQALESTTVGIYRTATVVKGGRRFSFAAMVVVGDRNGQVGLGYGKAPGVPAAIEKAQKDAKKNIVTIKLKSGTLPHPVTGIFGASKVRLLPAAPGTGVIAGGTARAVLEMAGAHDVLTKAYGSTNEKNLSKAVMQGLSQLRTREEVASHRGVEIEKTTVDEVLEASRRFMSEQASGEVKKAAAPVNTVGQKNERGGRGRGGGGGRGRGGGGGRGRGGQPQVGETTAVADSPAPATEAPAPEAPAPAGEAEPQN